MFSVIIYSFLRYPEGHIKKSFHIYFPLSSEPNIFPHIFNTQQEVMFTKLHAQCTVVWQFLFPIKYWWASCGLNNTSAFQSLTRTRTGMNHNVLSYQVFFSLLKSESLLLFDGVSNYSYSSYLWGFLSMSVLKLCMTVKTWIVVLWKKMICFLNLGQADCKHIPP